MDDKRGHYRIRCESRCLLYYEQKKYCGVIQDISLSGASVRIFGTTAGLMRPGGTCNLVLSGEPPTNFCNYTGKITRTGPFMIGLEFVDRRTQE